MSESVLFQTRRRFLRDITFGVAGISLYSFFDVPISFAEELTLTPRQTEAKVKEHMARPHRPDGPKMRPERGPMKHKGEKEESKPKDK